MDRVDADEVGAVARHCLRRRGQIAVVAEPQVAPRAQAVEGCGEAPGPGAPRNVSDRRRPRGRGDHEALVVFDAQAVNPDRQRQRDLPFVAPFEPVARLEREPPARGTLEWNAGRDACGHHDFLGDAPGGLARAEFFERLAGFDLTGRRHPHGGQQGALGIGAGDVFASRHVAPAGQDPHVLGEIREGAAVPGAHDTAPTSNATIDSGGICC